MNDIVELTLEKAEARLKRLVPDNELKFLDAYLELLMAAQSNDSDTYDVPSLLSLIWGHLGRSHPMRS